MTRLRFNRALFSNRKVIICSCWCVGCDLVGQLVSDLQAAHRVLRSQVLVGEHVEEHAVTIL